jgi:simple sugar transport system permease protein
MDASLFLFAVLSQTTPILLAALAAMITTRANILNVAVEGMMLVAAFTAIAVGDATGDAGIALLAALVAAVAVSLVYGFVAIVLHADFIVAGLGLNMLAAGGTLFLLERVYNSPGGIRPVTFPDLWHVPDGSLAWIPVAGRALEGQSVIVLVALAAVPLTWLFLYRTPLGYKLRAAGEEEHAARSAGIRVERMKLIAVLISGLLAGFAGAQLAMDRLHFFLPDMTSGRGFIGLAATLFGGGLPWMTAGASFLFGIFGALADRLQVWQLPSQFVLMIPYLAAILGLTVARIRLVLRNRPARVAGSGR